MGKEEIEQFGKELADKGELHDKKSVVEELEVDKISIVEQDAPVFMEENLPIIDEEKSREVLPEEKDAIIQDQDIKTKECCTKKEISLINARIDELSEALTKLARMMKPESLEGELRKHGYKIKNLSVERVE